MGGSIEGLQPDTTYQVRVIVNNGEGNASSEIVTVRTHAHPQYAFRLDDTSGTNPQVGRPEFFFRGKWGTVTDHRADNAGNEAAALMCKLEGFDDGEFIAQDRRDGGAHEYGEGARAVGRGGRGDAAQAGPGGFVAGVGEAAADEVGEERGRVGSERLGWLHRAASFVPVRESGGRTPSPGRPTAAPLTASLFLSAVLQPVCERWHGFGAGPGR